MATLSDSDTVRHDRTQRDGGHSTIDWTNDRFRSSPLLIRATTNGRRYSRSKEPIIASKRLSFAALTGWI
jgi:hypothetical protein